MRHPRDWRFVTRRYCKRMRSSVAASSEKGDGLSLISFIGDADSISRSVQPMSQTASDVHNPGSPARSGGCDSSSAQIAETPIPRASTRVALCSRSVRRSIWA